MPPSGARFAPWTTVRDRTGALYFASGTWRTQSGTELDDPKPLVIGAPTPASIVTPEGEEVEPGPTVLDAGVAPGATARDTASAQAIEDLDASRTFEDGSTMDAGKLEPEIADAGVLRPLEPRKGSGDEAGTRK
jgi:hypothetical protein